MTPIVATREEIDAAETALLKLDERLRAESPGADEATRLRRQAERIVEILRQGRLQWAQHQLRVLRRFHTGPQWSSNAAFRTFMELQAVWRTCMARLFRERFASTGEYKFDLEPHSFFMGPNACQRLFPSR